MPETREIKKAILTVDNTPLGWLTDYLLEIRTNDENMIEKLWIHDATGRTIVRIQRKDIEGLKYIQAKR